MNFAEKLGYFADLASGLEFEEDYCYFDVNDPESIKEADTYFKSELGFLSGQDRRELLDVWKDVCEDERNIRLFFNAIKVLQNKYA